MASAATPDMQHLTAAGRRLEYYWTAEHDGESPALIFLHIAFAVTFHLIRTLPGGTASRVAAEVARKGKIS